MVWAPYVKYNGGLFILLRTIFIKRWRGILHLTNQVTVLGNKHFRIYAVGSNPAVLLEGAVSALVPNVADQVQSGVVTRSINHLVIMHAVPNL
jgi:hypothetical protein